MNQTQKKYAIQRINEVASRKKFEAKEKFTTPEVELTQKQKYDLVAAGKVKALPFEKQNRYDEDAVYYDFSKHESVSKFDRAGYEKIQTELNRLVTSATDTIMLGDDCDEAVKILAQLENFKI